MRPNHITSCVLFSVALFTAHEGISQATIKSISGNMVLVEGGTFNMGCDYNCTLQDDALPVHKVTLNSFYISKYEVTRDQYRELMGRDPTTYYYCRECPVGNVDWDMIQEFITKLNRITGRKYRLPTEAEWEFAARGGNKTHGFHFSGSNDLHDVASIVTYNSAPIKVGTLLPNELGLYDMTGSVEEYVSDGYSPLYYKVSPESNPKGPKRFEGYRVIRGHDMYVFDRIHDYGGPDNDRGFRLAMDAPQFDSKHSNSNSENSMRQNGTQKQIGGWARCSICSSLWLYGKGSNPGKCYLQQGHELIDGDRILKFAIYVDQSTICNGQPEWKYCENCRRLWYSGDPSGKLGVCPGNANGHTSETSRNYFLCKEDDLGEGKKRVSDGWELCNKCLALIWRFNSRAICPAGGDHAYPPPKHYVILNDYD